MILFLLLFILNLTFIIWLIRWRGLFSCEGIAMAFMALIVGSDGMSLLWLYLFRGMDIISEIQLRFLPNIVLTIGLLSFACGLFTSNIKKRNIIYNLSIMDKKSKQKIFFTAYALILLGLFMKIYALYSYGFRNFEDYFFGLYMYQAAKSGGGFLDNGTNIAVLGLAILVALYNNSPWKRITAMICLVAISFLLTESKSGLHTAYIILFFTIYVFDQKLFSRLIKPKVLIFLFVLLFVGLGIKTQIKYSLNSIKSLPGSDIIGTSISTIAVRYSYFGLYRGYSFMVNRLVENPSLFFGTKILKNSLTGWIPRFIWQGKPEHPFLARGDLFNEDYQVDIYGNEAPTFTGGAFVDNGYPSLIIYLFLVGFILGFIRKKVTAQNKYQFLIVLSYIFFSCFMGPALAESSVLSLFYYIVFSIVLFFGIFIMLGIKNMLRISVSEASP